jgi:hypothetical protein
VRCIRSQGDLCTVLTLFSYCTSRCEEVVSFPLGCKIWVIIDKNAGEPSFYLSRCTVKHDRIDPADHPFCQHRFPHRPGSAALSSKPFGYSTTQIPIHNGDETRNRPLGLPSAPHGSSHRNRLRPSHHWRLPLIHNGPSIISSSNTSFPRTSALELTALKRRHRAHWRQFLRRLVISYEVDVENSGKLGIFDRQLHANPGAPGRM